MTDDESENEQSEPSESSEPQAAEGSSPEDSPTDPSELDRQAERLAAVKAEIESAGPPPERWLARAMVTLVIGIFVIGYVAYQVASHRDPCFPFKVDTALFLDDPNAWKVLKMDCRQVKGMCECVSIPMEPGEREWCASIEGRDEVFCTTRNTEPSWF